MYGELRSRVSPRNAVQMHIWQHAQHYVARHVDVIRGRPYHRPGSYHRTDIPLSHRQHPVYVCPKTGLLRRTPERARERRQGP